MSKPGHRGGPIPIQASFHLVVEPQIYDSLIQMQHVTLGKDEDRRNLIRRWVDFLIVPKSLKREFSSFECAIYIYILISVILSANRSHIHAPSFLNSVLHATMPHLLTTTILSLGFLSLFQKGFSFIYQVNSVGFWCEVVASWFQLNCGHTLLEPSCPCLSRLLAYLIHGSPFFLHSNFLAARQSTQSKARLCGFGGWRVPWSHRRVDHPSLSSGSYGRFKWKKDLTERQFTAYGDLQTAFFPSLLL